MEVLITFFVIILVIGALVVTGASVRIVHQSTVGVVERLGQYAGSREAGLVILLPFIETMKTAGYYKRERDHEH
jgi:regulator of protease activity HflC (stomatin/prohibitin superfamily)